MPRKNSKKIEYISLTKATEYCDYSQEYLSLRARQGKLKAKKFGRNWATTKEWVEDYFAKTNSQQARAKSKKANWFSFSYHKYFSAFARALGEVGETIKKSKIIFQAPEFKYIIAGVLAFAILEYGFAYAGPTLSMSKDFFVEGLAVFSEETNKGVSNFSESAWSFSDTVSEIVKVPSVNIPHAPTVSIPIVKVPPVPSVNIPPAPRINVQSFANFSILISENFPSTKSGARGITQNFRDTRNYVVEKIALFGQDIVLGARYTFIIIADIPPTVANNIFLASDDIGNKVSAQRFSLMSRFSIIADNEFYDLRYTGRMVSEYTQWLSQEFVPEPLYIAKENVVLGAASISNSCKSFYNKYVSKEIK